MEIALYARVSTNHQMQTQSIEQQLVRLQKAVSENPEWQLKDEHVYRDDGFTGAKLNRPGLDRLRDAASIPTQFVPGPVHPGLGRYWVAAFELVLVTAPDRLARKYVHQILLTEELSNLGCAFQFLERPMKDDDPHDQLLLQIRGAVAEYERSLIAERTQYRTNWVGMRRGRQAKLRAGTLLPWTRAPYGYILDPERPRDPKPGSDRPAQSRDRQADLCLVHGPANTGIAVLGCQTTERPAHSHAAGRATLEYVHYSWYSAISNLYGHGL